VSAKHLVIGLDGADVDVMHRIGRAALPNLFRLMDEGAWSRLESVMPCATLPNWTTFLTGMDPGRHGVFDFTTRIGTRVAFTGGTARQEPTIGKRLDAMGRRCAVIGFPGTFPPEALKHGAFVSGWDSPVDFEADRSYVHPPELFDALVKRFGAYRFDEVDEFIADSEGWHARLGEVLEARIEKRTELALWMLEQEPSWDLFAFYFGESDTASHHLLSLWDETAPRHPSDVSALEKDGLARVYRALDRAVGRLVDAAGSCELTVLSDHGSGPASDKIFFVNQALASLGFLSFHARDLGTSTSPLASLRKLGMRAIPPRAKHALFHAFGRALPGWLESRTRFADIDFARTRVFSDELNYFPALHYNLRGRESNGTLDPEDVPRVFAALESALLNLRDPWTNAPIVRALWPREALYEGPHVMRAPDVVVELELDLETCPKGATYNLMPSSESRGGQLFRRLEASELRGRKGRSLAGSHRQNGLYIAHGPRVARAGELSMRMADATATLLARMDIAPSAEMAGRVADELFVTPNAPSTELVHVTADASPLTDLARTEARLRALGYVDGE
jgi:predicted AlkP superfamily phosphohydrolase/phosphomutase